MNFPVTRQLHRYEFVVEAGFVTGKRVVDLGCGTGQGAAMLCMGAVSVLGVDLALPEAVPVNVPIYASIEKKLTLLRGDFFRLGDEQKFDVAVSQEVFEHMPDLERYLGKVAALAEYFFVTTPLAAVTGPTDNPEHIAEYSRKDFHAWLGRYFEILDEFYQHGDLTISKIPCPHGSSMKPDHVVQMAWCRAIR